jgi:hypothetical protein
MGVTFSTVHRRRYRDRYRRFSDKYKTDQAADLFWLKPFDAGAKCTDRAYALLNVTFLNVKKSNQKKPPVSRLTLRVAKLDDTRRLMPPCGVTKLARVLTIE